MNARVFSLQVLALACLFLAGCGGPSKNPLSDPKTSKPDPRLAGVWRTTDKGGEITYYHAGPLGDKLPPSVMRVVGVKHLQNGGVQAPCELLIFPTVLGHKTYLNVTGGEEKEIKLLADKGWGSVDEYLLMKYQVDGDTLLLWGMDENAVKRAIEGGKVKGTIQEGKDKTGPIATFTDTTENLARFVAAAGDDLFSKDALRLERVK